MTAYSKSIIGRGGEDRGYDNRRAASVIHRCGGNEPTDQQKAVTPRSESDRSVQFERRYQYTRVWNLQAKPRIGRCTRNLLGNERSFLGGQ